MLCAEMGFVLIGEASAVVRTKMALSHLGLRRGAP